MTRVQDFFLAVQFSVEVGVLLLAVYQQASLVVNLVAKSADHADIGLHTALEVILHSPLLIGYSIEILLKVQKLILKRLIVSFPLPEFHGFLSELSNQSVLVVLVDIGG